MPRPFDTIGLIGKYGDPGVADSLQALGRFLLDRNREVLLDEATAELLPQTNLVTASREEIGRRCQLAIVIGGDGTMLNAGRSLNNQDIAVLGINLGRLGFLTDVSRERMTSCLETILDGEYQEDQRFLLTAKIERQNGRHLEFSALNDVVVHKSDVARMIETTTFINGRFVSTQRSDGLIVATPTGSTAYALSGGGPILYPGLDSIVLVPICPHTLSHRPIVVDANSRIEVLVSEASSAHTQVTCDGQANENLMSGDRIVIGKHPRPLRLIHPREYDYFEILRVKLGWGEHPHKPGA